MTDKRTGTVYIAQRLESVEAPTKFYGHWEPDEAGSVEQGPGWDNAEAAITWGRTRAPIVVARLGSTPPQQHYSAGDILPTGTPPEGGILPWS